jgi:hypothetical protein
MLTDSPPRKANRAWFLESDRIRTLNLPQDGGLLAITQSVESPMKAGTTADVHAPAQSLGSRHCRRERQHHWYVPPCYGSLR